MVRYSFANPDCILFELLIFLITLCVVDLVVVTVAVLIAAALMLRVRMMRVLVTPLRVVITLRCHIRTPSRTMGVPIRLTPPGGWRC